MTIKSVGPHGVSDLPHFTAIREFVKQMQKPHLKVQILAGDPSHSVKIIKCLQSSTQQKLYLVVHMGQVL